MADAAPLYAGFLGTWVLIPESCQYEQSAPPRAATHRIEARGGALHFVMDWTAADGGEHHAELSGVPDGVRAPFDGGALADALAITAVSARDLRTAAYWRGEELMVAQRQLDATGAAMRVTQLVRLPDGRCLADVGVYRKRVLS